MPRPWTKKDEVNLKEIRLGYCMTLLKVEWGGKTPRERNKLRRREPLLTSAIEGILENFE